MKTIKTILLVSVAYMFICGFAYPMIVTALGQVFFPYQANGSLIVVNDQVVGAEHVGQEFTEDYYFKGRPSAVNYNTHPSDEEGTPSSGSYNYGSTNPELQARVEESIATFLAANPTIKADELPVDLFTASGSGLDPHISVEAALVQVDGIVKASGLSIERINQIIENNTLEKTFGFIGERRVNVLACNIEIAKELKLVK